MQIIIVIRIGLLIILVVFKIFLLVHLFHFIIFFIITSINIFEANSSHLPLLIHVERITVDVVFDLLYDLRFFEFNFLCFQVRDFDFLALGGFLLFSCQTSPTSVNLVFVDVGHAHVVHDE